MSRATIATCAAVLDIVPAADHPWAGHRYIVTVDGRHLHVEVRRRLVDPPAGWEAIVYDPDLTYATGPPRVQVNISGTVIASHGLLAAPYLTALGLVLAHHFHGA